MSVDGKETPVAVLTLYSCDGKNESKNFIFAYGHTFMSIVNISENVIEPAYGIDIEKGESIFFSWWAIDTHMGIWFNIEPNYIKNFGRYTDRVSLSRYISRTELEKIRDYLTRNDLYSPVSNCAKNCTDLWNLCAGKDSVYYLGRLRTPKRVCKEIRKRRYFETDRPINTNGRIFFLSYGKTDYFELEKRK